ncbi:rhomboid family intramembrane serine protease [Schlesneria paludicola]|uniref:rhomboid family intramembrane serine protease n=1 Tax=Schlesneria paludicola TaxID=360056 RepID=UPI00058C09D4|nr:rhomboid family intramembrane serine protease [Schlesneria paludicola]
MGSSYRDYMQDRDDQGPTWGHDTPTTKWLIVVTVIVFFLQVFMTHRAPVRSSGPSVDAGQSATVQLVSQTFHGMQPSFVEDWLLLDDAKVRSGQIWRLVTYVFCHPRDNAFSILFNMLVLWFLGSILERGMYRSSELLWFYLTTAVLCGLVFVGFGYFMRLPDPLLGSSACVMALLTLYATHYPTREILVFWIVPVQIRVVLLIAVALDVFTIVNAYQGNQSWVVVAYLTSLWGIAFGYAYRRFDLNLTAFMETFDPRRLRRSVRNLSARRRLKVFQPEPTVNLNEEVDAILAKIHEQGSESLTDRERAILQKASERAKNRM